MRFINNVACVLNIDILLVQFCLGGCNPYGSYSINSCKPMPVCQSTNDTFSNTSKIQMNATQWDGDASKYGTSSQEPLVRERRLVSDMSLVRLGLGTRPACQHEHVRSRHCLDSYGNKSRHKIVKYTIRALWDNHSETEGW